MSYHRQLAAWEDQRFSSKDAFALVSKRLLPKEEVGDELPVKDTAGVFDKSSFAAIKEHERRQANAIKRQKTQEHEDAEEFKKNAVPQEEKDLPLEEKIPSPKSKYSLANCYSDDSEEGV